MEIKYTFNGQAFIYDYEIDSDDLVDYALPPALKGTVAEDDYKSGTLKAIQLYGINKAKLEEDEHFIRFIHDRYEEIAQEQFESEN